MNIRRIIVATAHHVGDQRHTARISLPCEPWEQPAPVIAARAPEPIIITTRRQREIAARDVRRAAIIGVLRAGPCDAYTVAARLGINSTSTQPAMRLMAMAGILAATQHGMAGNKRMMYRIAEVDG